MAEIALILIVLIVGLAIAIRYFARRGSQMADLRARGTEGTSHVIDAQRVRRSRTHMACRVRYAFATTGGVRYEREVEVLPKEFANYHEGQEIGIVYDPVNPENNMMNEAVVAAREASKGQRMLQTGE